MSTLTIDVSDELVERIAERAAELVTETPNTTAEPWLNVEQAAAHLALSSSQVYSLCSARRTNGFPVTKEGSRSYFRASELDRWRKG
jgi:predicted DNA-binding transcriptional regulator AlpA